MRNFRLARYACGSPVRQDMSSLGSIYGLVMGTKTYYSSSVEMEGRKLLSVTVYSDKYVFLTPNQQKGLDILGDVGNPAGVVWRPYRSVQVGRWPFHAACS